MPAIFVAALAAGQKLLRESDSARLQFDTFILESPLLGNLVNKFQAVRILHVLRNTLEVGIRLSSALKLSKDVVTNLKVRERLTKTIDCLLQGHDLGDALLVNDLLPPVACSMLSVGAESATLDTMTARICGMLEEEVESSLVRATKLLEPLLLGLAGLAAGFVALAGLMPLLNTLATL